LYSGVVAVVACLNVAAAAEANLLHLQVHTCCLHAWF
jgi:hypothetical protein